MKSKLLVVEDESKTAQELRIGLEQAGFDTNHAKDGKQGLRMAIGGGFDGLIVDIMLPGMSGLELVKQLREAGVQTPVLFLSAKDTWQDRLRGLEEGGDDYLIKPYAFPEVLARIRKLIQRWPTPESDERIQVADLIWEPKSHKIIRGGQRIDLTPREINLAELLLRNRGEVVTRAQIEKYVWGLDFEGGPRVVDVQMMRLRAKLDDPFEVKLIHTLRGIGYVFEDRSNS